MLTRAFNADRARITRGDPVEAGCLDVHFSLLFSNRYNTSSICTTSMSFSETTKKRVITAHKKNCSSASFSSLSMRLFAPGSTGLWRHMAVPRCLSDREGFLDGFSKPLIGASHRYSDLIGLQLVNIAGQAVRAFYYVCVRERNNNKKKNVS